MKELIDMKDDIVDWLFFVNVFALIISFLSLSKWLFIVVMIINIILGGTFIIMSKWGDKFAEQINREDDDGNVSR